MKNNKLPFIAALALSVGAGGLHYVTAETPVADKAAPKLKVGDFRAKLKRDDSPLPNNGQLVMSYAPVAEKILPSVVRITSSVPVKTPSMNQIPPQWREFFRRFGMPDDGSGADPFGGGGEEEEEQPQPRRRGQGRNVPKEHQEQKGTGSGVIITSDGYILTNNHVVADADKIEVAVGSDTKNFKAKVIGTDPMTDVAIIKIEATNLPVATIADSAKLHVGDVVLAAGNPMELSQTITQGIISAMGRTGMGIVHQGMNAGIENFIQTDAAINPGNSGGPLVDAMGRVIGINTAIMTRSGMNSGIGFSIPINLALRVAEDLIDDGKVSRGFLGVGMQDLSPEDAKAMGLGEAGGVLVNSVVSGSPAEKAGIQEGDVVTSVGGQHVDNGLALRSIIASATAGTAIEVNVLRDGKQLKLKATLQSASDEELAQRRGGKFAPGNQEKVEPAKFIKGVTVQEISDGLRQRYDIPASVTKGVVVVALEANTAAAGSGLEEGDVILAINNKPVATLVEAKTAVKGDDGVVGLRISRKGAKQFIVVREDGKNE